MKKDIFLSIIPIIYVIIGLSTCSLYEVYTDTAELSDIIRNLQPRIIELDDITIKTQPNGFTCGITSVTVISNYFNNTDYEADVLIKKYNTNANSHDDMIKCIKKEIPGITVIPKSNGSNKDMINGIHFSLNNNNPVLISFGSPNPYNKPYYDFHASVVYGINLDKETITIANSYGYKEEISFVDFLNRMLYTEIDKYPVVQQFQIRRNRVARNVYFLFEQ